MGERGHKNLPQQQLRFDSGVPCRFGGQKNMIVINYKLNETLSPYLCVASVRARTGTGVGRAFFSSCPSSGAY